MKGQKKEGKQKFYKGSLILNGRKKCKGVSTEATIK